LVDIHGQNENLTLMDEKSYMTVLDGYAGCSEQALSYRKKYAELEEIRRRLRELACGEAERLRMIEMLRFQIADIEAVNPKPGEDAALEEKEKRIKNRERITRQTSFVYKALKGAERGSVAYLLEKSVAALEPLSALLPETERLCEELNDCRYRIEDMAERVYDMTDPDEGDPTALIDRIEARLDAFSKLRKKYGGTIEEVLRYRDEAKERLSALDASDDTVAELREKESSLKKEATLLADSLHSLRCAAAKELEKRITEILLYLDMPKVVFRIPVARRALPDGTLDLNRDGGDDVQFVMSANAGDIPRPLSAIASGGELARTFLALKCVLAEKALTPTMIFDEIDTGVSGKTARKIGIKLSAIAKTTQVLCITHSAQIASLATAHYKIAKHAENDRAFTTVTPLDEAGRVSEVARILGGLSVTQTQLDAASEMIEEGCEYR
jgi:DNA repair protein RecN (Recombination protein N)